MGTTDFERTLSWRVLYPVCSMSQNEFDSEEQMEAVAEGLNRSGVRAFADDTGGGIICVVVPRANGGEISWGTADVNWGASVTTADGTFERGLETKCASDTQDVDAIVAALRGPSIDAGAERVGRL